jgi:ATP-dependent phosphoenolpyruvate carboxykinase
VQTDEWSLFPRETEGNVYAVNWSLCEDGVVPVGDAFRNARVSMLTKKMGVKVAAGKLEAKNPAYSGKYTVQESGDSISHEEFSEMIAAQQAHLSSGIELFVEDAALGALGAIRNGVRVVTDDAATALIARSLLVSGLR